MATSNIGVNVSTGVVGVCLDNQTLQTVTQIVNSLSSAVLAGNIERYFGADREVLKALGHATTRVCLLDFDSNPEEALRTAERIRNETDSVSVFAVCSHATPDCIIGAMRAGCSEFLTKPLQNMSVMDALVRVQTKQKEVRFKNRGKVVALLGAKGGTGVTCLALHLAIHLVGHHEHSCLLVDEHPSLGDASLYLGTGRHQYSFFELANNTERLDQELLKGFLLHHDSGLDLLDSPETLDAAHMASQSAVEQTLAFLAEQYEFVLVDCPPGLSDTVLATLAQSDQVAVVITPELPAVRNAVRYLEHLTRLGYPDSQIRVALNRYSKRGPLRDDQIEKALGRPLSIRVPNAYAEVIRAINAGLPIMPDQKSEFGAALQGWANELKGKGSKIKAASAQERGGFKGMLGL